MQAQLAQAEGQAAQLQTSRAQLETQLQQLRARSAPCIMIDGTSGLAGRTQTLWCLCPVEQNTAPMVLPRYVMPYSCAACHAVCVQAAALEPVETWLVCMM